MSSRRTKKNVVSKDTKNNVIPKGLQALRDR
jgi:hypothetical protein